MSPKPVWWLVFCVNLTGPQGPRYLAKIFLRVSVRVFFDEINMEISRLHKADGPPPEWVGLMQSAEGLNRTKRLTLLWVRENSSCPMAFELGHQLFPAFGLELKHWLFLSLETAGLWAGTTSLGLLVLRPLDSDRNQTIGSPGPPASWLTCRPWDLPASIIVCEPVPHNKSLYTDIPRRYCGFSSRLP